MLYIYLCLYTYLCVWSNRVTSKVMSSLHVNIQFIKALDFVDMKAPGLSRCRDVVPQPQRDPLFPVVFEPQKRGKKMPWTTLTGPLFLLATTSWLVTRDVGSMQKKCC